VSRDSAIERDRWRLHALVAGGAGCAVGAFLGAILRDASPLEVWGAIALALGALIAGALWLGRVAKRFPVAPALSPVFVLMGIGPWVWQVVVRVAGYDGSPLEVVLISSVLCLVCGLAAAGCWREFQPLAMLGSLFVVMFSATLWNGALPIAGTAGFALCGLAWLVIDHWAALSLRMKDRRRASPRGTLVLPGVLAGCLVVGLALGGANRIWSLKGWMPSSGGDGNYDPAAMSGVGNGDALVSGQDNIQSFGPIEDAPFRSSEQPSLYDVFNELYDEPVTTKNMDRSVALPPEFGGVPEKRMTRTERAAREFSTLRKMSSSTAKVEGLRSNALLYVKGRVPLHMRLTIHDLFDGITWYPADPPPEEKLPRLTMAKEGPRSWLIPGNPARAWDFLAPTESHALKIIHLDTNRIPTPLFLRGLHIDLLDDPTFYKWAGDGLLALDRKKLPSLTTIHLRSRAVNHRLLAKEVFWSRETGQPTAVLPVGGEMEQVRRLAHAWTVGVPRGSAQIDAIVSRLKAEYVLDRDHKTAPDSPLPVADFLLRERRGPDYQFATATAVLLRSLGYSTRFVTGFYAAPERFDRAKEHTPILGEDAHAWVEVYLAGPTWVAVEPTPGYELLATPPGWWDRVVATARKLAAGAFAVWPVLVTVGMVLLVGWRERDRLADLAVTGWWRLRPVRTQRERVLATFGLVEYRGRLARAGRPRGKSPERWLTGFSHWTPDERALLVEFARRVDWSLFAPESVAATSDVPSLCERVASLCTRGRFATSARPPMATPSLKKSVTIPVVTTPPRSEMVSLQLQFTPPTSHKH
jgi:protein-glutamine gamma-glutamyltransferase